MGMGPPSAIANDRPLIELGRSPDESRPEVEGAEAPEVLALSVPRLLRRRVAEHAESALQDRAGRANAGGSEWLLTGWRYRRASKRGPARRGQPSGAAASVRQRYDDLSAPQLVARTGVWLRPVVAVMSSYQITGAAPWPAETYRPVGIPVAGSAMFVPTLAPSR
jgi:hypothetical protein